MKHQHKKLTAIFASALLCLCACTPAIDNGLVRSGMDHLTVPEAVPSDTEQTEVSDETGITDTDSAAVAVVQDDFDPAASPGVTGFSEDIMQQANTLLSQMTLEEKVGQMFLVRCPETGGADAAASCHLGGYILYNRDFENKTREQIVSEIQNYQNSTSIPMFIAVDEEGGIVVRVSSNPQLRLYPFWSPQDLYEEGGYELISSDTEEKAVLLKSLGINLNLAPVCDISTTPSDYIYERSFGQPAQETAQYVSTVVGAMNRQGIGSTLKHFPGYGNNTDTHEGLAYDTRSYETFVENDFIPFKQGIYENATAVLVSHTIVECMDSENPASLSRAVHDILRNELAFDGIIMTDDLSMEAITQYSDGESAAVQAILAGNDIICCTDYETEIPAVIEAVNTGAVSEARVDQAVLRILASKLELGIIQ